MERRHFIRGIALLGACAAYIGAERAAQGAQWGYAGHIGPGHWASLDQANAVCSAGSQQSPVNITDAIEADLPVIEVGWDTGGTMVNNGHTIQINVPEGGFMKRGGRTYDLLQYHFHSPSEHLVNGTAHAMELHFVHRDAATGKLGVLGVFLEPGAGNAAFASLASAFPAEVGGEASVTVDPTDLLPPSREYWTYEGSLTTPPCSEIVDWMVLKQPLEVAAGDIDTYRTLYSGNARPVVATDRRFILASS